MARNRVIEAILAAWYARDVCPDDMRAKAEENLNHLLDQVIQNTPHTREQVKDHLFTAYKEYRRTRTANQKLEDRHAAE